MFFESQQVDVTPILASNNVDWRPGVKRFFRLFSKRVRQKAGHGDRNEYDQQKKEGVKP